MKATFFGFGSTSNVFPMLEMFAEIEKLKFSWTQTSSIVHINSKNHPANSRYKKVYWKKPTLNQNFKSNNVPFKSIIIAVWRLVFRHTNWPALCNVPFRSITVVTPIDAIPQRWSVSIKASLIINYSAKRTFEWCNRSSLYASYSSNQIFLSLAMYDVRHATCLNEPIALGEEYLRNCAKLWAKLNNYAIFQLHRSIVKHL